jgi:PAS domain S-box-containing protein
MPQGGALRVEALDQHDPPRPSADPALIDLARLTARICNCPVGAAMLLEGSRKVYSAAFGATLFEQNDAETPCERTILLAGDREADQIYEIPDAYLDDLYADTGIAIGGHVYRFYAGTPLINSEGVVLGTLFVADAVTGRLDPSQRDALTILSRQVVTRLELTSRMRAIDLASRDLERTDTALTVERNFVSAVLDTVGALVAVFDTAGRIVRLNRACETASGYDSTELVGRFVWERLVPKDDVADAMREFESIRAGGFPATFENHWLTREGGLRRIAWSATALLDAQEQVAFIIATGIDVTVQRAAEETLIESEARYRLIVEGSLGMVCTHDVEGMILSVNRNGAATIGRTIDEIVGRSLADLLPEGATEAFEAYLGQITETGEAQGLMHMCHLDGSIRVIAYRNKLVAMPGYASHVLAFGVDVTEKVRAETELRALVRQSNSVLESIGDGVFGLDLEGRVKVVNAAAAEMLGYTQEELMGRSMHETIHHTRTDGSPYLWQDCPINKSLTKLNTIRVSTEAFWRKDGTSFPVDYVARPQIDIDTRPGREGRGNAVGVVVAFTDTTERQALNQMKDEFVSTVSHELRTPLTSLRAALGLVHSGTLSARPEKTSQMLEIAIGNTDRLVTLVNDILDLERIQSGKAELHYTMCSVDDLLRGAAAMREKDAKKVNIEFDVESGEMQVWADPDRIIQVVTNLISNAIKFSPEGGRVLLKAIRAGKDEAQIEVRDSGQGIPEDMLEQIFDRFQQVDASDSRAMGGTGLGLAICRGIVLQHGGRIWATSRPGDGASFFFTLPTKAKEHLG